MKGEAVIIIVIEDITTQKNCRNQGIEALEIEHEFSELLRLFALGLQCSFFQSVH